MGPVASKLLKEIRKSRRSKVVQLDDFRDAAARRDEAETLPEELEALPPNHREWMRFFQLVSPAAADLLGSKALRKLAIRIEAIEEEYMPGDPPMSPVRDSVFVNWWLCDAPVGPRRETLATILAEIGPAIGIPEHVNRLFACLGHSRMGVYRVEQIEPGRVRLREISRDFDVRARVPDDMDARGSLWLTRLLPPIVSDAPDDWVVWTTPYHLIERNAVDDWLAYTQRVVAGEPTKPADEVLAQHFKAVDEPIRWLDYIMNGYAGVTPDSGAIGLRGVPDRPETLPLHPDHGDDTGNARVVEEATPLERVRARLLASHVEDSPEEVGAAVRRKLGLPDEPQSAEVEWIMTTAYRMYGRLGADGHSALDRLRARADELPADECAVLDSLAAGWFSAFEVARVRVDEGMELRDVLRRRKKLWVRERSATRGVDLGDVLAGWVMVEDDAFGLEGALCRIPRFVADDFVNELRKIRDQLARRHPKLDWKRRAGLLAPYVGPLQEWSLARAAPPEIRNTDGDEILLSTAHYDVADRDRVADALAETFTCRGEQLFSAVVEGTEIATLELTDGTMDVKCNSRRRLDEMKGRLANLLGDAAVHRLDSHEDPSKHIEEAWHDRGKSPPTPEPKPELPPEANEALRAMLLERMRRWIDEPIPVLGGKTPRQAVRSAAGRDHVTLLLCRQQEIFDGGGGLPAVDLTEIWSSLGLRRPG